MATSDHFSHLRELLALERKEELSRFHSERENLSLVERAARGLVVLDLEATNESWGLGGRFLVVLEPAGRAELSGKFGVGDLVEVRPRKAEQTEPATALVARRTRSRLTLAFERPPPGFVTEGRLRLDLLPNEVTFERARWALGQVEGWDRGEESRRRSVLLGTGSPRYDEESALTAPGTLNPEQGEAVRRALAARDLFLVHGPPGTGKSTVLVEVAAQSIARGNRVLATAASNAAVDHLLDLCVRRGLRAVRLGHPARVSERLVEHSLDLLVERHPARVAARDLFDEAYELLGYARRQRSQGRSRARFANARDAQAQAQQMLREARQRERQAVRGVLEDAEVICATCASLPGADLAGVKLDLAVLDEATQAIEPIALLPFLYAPRVVLAGDHRQLPPTVISRQAQQAGLATSLFERLLGCHDDGVGLMLLEQYRMSEGIMAFPSQQMYAGKLRAHPSVASHRLAELLDRPELDAPPVIFLDTAGKGLEDRLPAGSQSYENPGEAALVARRVGELTRAGLGADAIGVIAPYRAQVTRLRAEFEAHRLPDVEVDTVDAFQGREKEAVLVSLTRSNPDSELGFLGDLRRMNVAITRARRHLFVVGDSATLANHPFYATFIDHIQLTGGYRSVWEWPDPEG